MKKFIIWTILSMFFMIGFPWLAVEFAGGAGMGVCFILFYAVNPLFSAVCGVFSGQNIKQLWALPIVTAALFLTGTWIFFETGEPAFLLYGGCYLIIGVMIMIITALAKNRRQ